MILTTNQQDLDRLVLPLKRFIYFKQFRDLFIRFLLLPEFLIVKNTQNHVYLSLDYDDSTESLKQKYLIDYWPLLKIRCFREKEINLLHIVSWLPTDSLELETEFNKTYSEQNISDAIKILHQRVELTRDILTNERG